MKPVKAPIHGRVVLATVLVCAGGLALPAAGQTPQPAEAFELSVTAGESFRIKPLGSANLKKKTIRSGQGKVLAQPLRRNRELPATDEPGGPPQLMLETRGFTGAVVGGLAFSPDGKLLAAAGDVVRIWDVATGELTHTLRGQTEMGGVGSCTNLAFAPDGKHLVVTVSGLAGAGGNIRVYDTADFSEIDQVLGGHDGAVTRLAFSRDGRWLVTGGTDSRLVVWDWEKRRRAGRAVREGKVKPPEGYPSQPKGPLDPEVLDWAIAGQVGLPQPLEHLGFPGREPFVLALDSEGEYYYLSAPDLKGPPAQVAREFKNRFETVLDGIRGWPDNITPYNFTLSLRFDKNLWSLCGITRKPEGAGSEVYWYGVWSTQPPARLQTYKGHRYYGTACTLSPDGDLAASADALGDIDVWEVKSGTRQKRFAGVSQPLYGVALDPSGKVLAYATRAADRGWGDNHYGDPNHAFDLARRGPAAEVPSNFETPLTARDGRRLESRRRDGDHYELSVWRGATRETFLPFAGSARWKPLCYSFLRTDRPGAADGVVVGSEAGGLGCLDPVTLMGRRAFVGHRDAVFATAQSPDRRLLASASRDGTLCLWSLTDFQPRGGLAAATDLDDTVYHVFPNTPTAAAGLKIGDRILTVDGKTPNAWLDEFVRTRKWPFQVGQRVEVEWDRQGGPNSLPETLKRTVKMSDVGDIVEPLLTLLVADDGKEWVVWTPQGYYDASPQGDRLVGWHVNNGWSRAASFYPLDRFSKTFYRPDIIQGVLETGDVDKAVALANAALPRPQTNPDPRERPGWDRMKPPTVRILEPADGAHSRRARITVRAEVRTSEELPVKDVLCLVNGLGRGEKNIVRQPEPRAAVQTIEREVTLQPGRNEIAVVAENTAARSNVEKVMVTLDDTPGPAGRPNLYVLAVGISRYANAKFNLDFARPDAEDFAAAWKTQEGLLYGKVTTRVLTDEEATRARIEKGMDWLVKSAGKQDVAMLFLSGHGVCDNNRNYYLATHEIDPNELRSTGLRYENLNGLIRDLPCRVLVFADTCHSGGLRGLDVPLDALRPLYSEEAGAIVFASSLPSEVSLEDPKWQHGAFTKALLETLNSRASDINGDGFLSVTELDHHLATRVRELTQDRQHPATGKPSTVPDFNLFKVR
jgi:WD40 repeat protein